MRWPPPHRPGIIAFAFSRQGSNRPYSGFFAMEAGNEKVGMWKVKVKRD
jgi:hypothetical protein